MEYKYIIQELQDILNISDDVLCKKLNISKRKLNSMKEKNEKQDFKRIKTILIHERVKCIKFLK